MFSAPTDFSICSVEDEADLAPGSAPPLGLDWAASLPRGSIASRYLFVDTNHDGIRLIHASSQALKNDLKAVDASIAVLFYTHPIVSCTHQHCHSRRHPRARLDNEGPVPGAAAAAATTIGVLA